MVLSVLTGASVYENVLFILLVVDWAILSPAGNAIAIVSSVLAFIYAIMVLMYLFKKRQDGLFMQPLMIFGLGQGVMITVMRILFFVGLIQHSNDYTDSSLLWHYIILSTLVGVLVSIAQVVMQYVVMRRDLALAVSQADEYHRESIAGIVKEEIPHRRLRVCLAVLSGVLLFDSGEWVYTFLFNAKDFNAGSLFLVGSYNLTCFYAIGIIGYLSLKL